MFYNAAVGDAVRSGFPAEYDFIPAIQAHGRAVIVLVGTPTSSILAVSTRGRPVGGSLGAYVVPRAGHALWIGQPEQFAELVAKALAPQDR